MPVATPTLKTTMTTRPKPSPVGGGHQEPGLAKLLTWFSPAFPVGSFAYSHGLEWAVEAGDIRNEADLLAWVADLIRHGSGRTDMVLLRHAHRAADADALSTVAGSCCRPRLAHRC